MCIAQHYISEHRHCFKRYLCRNSRPLWRECGVQGLWGWLVMRAPLLSCHVTLRLQLPRKKVTIIVILLETERKIQKYQTLCAAIITGYYIEAGYFLHLFLQYFKDAKFPSGGSYYLLHLTVSQIRSLLLMSFGRQEMFVTRYHSTLSSDMPNLLASDVPADDLGPQ